MFCIFEIVRTVINRQLANGGNMFNINTDSVKELGLPIHLSLELERILARFLEIHAYERWRESMHPVRMIK